MEKTGLNEFLAAAAAMSPKRRRLIQRLAIRRMQRKGKITKAQAKKLKAMGWESFLEWLLENGPEIIEFIMMLISLFGGL
jgi:hypothetical protein